MINGQCPTWFVAKWLSKHHGHYACTPRLPYEYRYACYSDNGSGAVIRGACEIRNDWTIFRADGTPVKFKKKRCAVDTGIHARTGEQVRVLSGDGRTLLGLFRVTSNGGTVLIREREMKRSKGLPSSQAIRMFLEETENNEKTSRNGNGVSNASSVRTSAGKRRRS